MILSKNENTFLKYVARCLVHNKCSTTVITGNHVSYTSWPCSLFCQGEMCRAREYAVHLSSLHPYFLDKSHFLFTLLFQFADLVAPAYSLPWLCEEDPHHWCYFVADQLHICPRLEWGTKYLQKTDVFQGTCC